MDGCISGVHVAQSFSLLCDVLSTIVSLSVLLMLFFALCILRVTASDYPFGIFKFLFLFLLINGNTKGKVGTAYML